MKNFKITKKIGGGAEGAVYLAISLLDDDDTTSSGHKEVAVKSIVCHSDQDIETTRNEVTYFEE